MLGYSCCCDSNEFADRCILSEAEQGVWFAFFAIDIGSQMTSEENVLFSFWKEERNEQQQPESETRKRGTCPVMWAAILLL